MKKVLFVLLIFPVLSVSLAYSGSWDSTTQTYNPSQGQVVFYDSSGCKGEPYIVLPTSASTEEPNFGSYSFHDKTSCIVVGANTKVTVYEHGNYGGWAKTFVAGNSPKTYKLSSCWDNKISSAKIYTNPSPQETSQMMPSSYSVVLYDNPDCMGMPWYSFSEGDYSDMRRYQSAGYGNWNDKASCMIIGPMTKVTIYQKVNYGGKSKTYTTTSESKTISFECDWWDDTISSLKVKRN